MAGRIDPYAFTNAFNAERDRGQRNRLFQAEQEQQTLENSRANEQMQMRRDEFSTQQRTAEANRTRQTEEAKNQSIQRVAGIAQQALKMPPQGRKQFLQRAAQMYGNDFTAAGADLNDIPALIQQDDMDLENDLKEVAAFGPQQEAPVQYERQDGPRGSVLQRDPRTNELKQVVGPDNTQAGSAPSGYTWQGGRLAPIPGGPADPNTPSTKDDQRVFAKADKLRDEFNAQSKEFITVGDSYNVVQETARNPSAAGDLSMIFAYMKMLDPNSVVREQEFANAQNAAGVPERIRNAYNKALNGERLNVNQRQDFINQAKGLYDTRKGRQDSITKRYTEIAKRNRVNPEDVVGDMAVVMSADQGPVQVKTPAEAAKLPSGTRFVTPDGQVRVKR